jgi:hypothetical protein
MRGIICAVAVLVIGPWGCSSGDAARTDGDATLVDAGMTDRLDEQMGPSMQLCTDVCDVGYSLECPGVPPREECIEGCSDPNASCPAESKTFYECVVAHGPASLTCGVMSVRVAAYCIQEGMNLADCLSMEPAASVLASMTPRRPRHSMFSLRP